MNTLLRFLLGGGAGALVGALGTIVYSGPLDLQVIGPFIAFALVFSGAWFLWEAARQMGWLGYIFGLAASVLWLLFFPPADDAFGVFGSANLWLVGAAIAAVIPAVVFSLRKSDS